MRGRPPTGNESIIIRIPADVKQKAAKLAEQDGRTVNAWITRLVEKAVSYEEMRTARNEEIQAQRERGDVQTVPGSWIG